MKYKELKSLVEQVMAELNLAQGKNRIPSKKKSTKRPDYPDVDNDGDKEESMEKALKDKKKNKMNETYGGLSQSEIEDKIKKDPDFLKKLEDATKKAMNGNTTDLMAIMGGFPSLVKAEYNSPEEEDDIITKPDIEEPAPKTKPRHPLMPPEESPEDEPKMRVKKEGKITINDILTKYKNLKKNEA